MFARVHVVDGIMVSHNDVAQPCEVALDSCTFFMNGATGDVNYIYIMPRSYELLNGVKPSGLSVDDRRDDNDVLAYLEHSCFF